MFPEGQLFEDNFASGIIIVYVIARKMSHDYHRVHRLTLFFDWMTKAILEYGIKWWM